MTSNYPSGVALLVLMVLVACNGRVTAVKPHPAYDTVTKVAKDSLINRFDPDARTAYVEHARLVLPDHIIALTSQFGVVDGKIDEACRYGASTNYFVHIDKRTGKADTVEAGLDNLGGCDMCKFIMRDLTDSLHLNNLLVQVVTAAEDIYYTNSFVGIKDGEFKLFFSISDTREDGVRLHREGTKLVGKTSGRDDIVENLEFDYPVVVDVKTFEETDSTPDPQCICYETIAEQSFRAHRVIGGRVDNSLVVVKAGDPVTIGTYYRSAGKVRVRLQDSTEVEIKAETAKAKLRHNGAG